MARAQIVEGGGGLQPVGQARFAAAGARVERSSNRLARAEEVEIGGVRMMGVNEAFAGFSAAVPAVFEACDASLVKADGAANAFSVPLGAGLPPDEGDEDG